MNPQANTSLLASLGSAGSGDPNSALSSLYQAQYGQPQQQVAPPVQAAPTPAPQKGNWFTHLLPTAGGIIGGIGGEIADVFGGGIVGAAGGSALGKTLENKLEGNSLGSGVVGQAIGGGIGQGVGGVLGKAAGAIGGKILGTATKDATSADKPGLFQSLSNKFFAGQFAPGTIDKNLATDLTRKYGITDSNHIKQITPLLTGSSDAEPGQALINKAVENGLVGNTGNPHLDISDITGNFTKSGTPIDPVNLSFTQQILNKTHGLSANDEKTILNNVNTEVSKLNTSINGNTDNMSALALSRALANKADDLRIAASSAAGSSKTGLQSSSSVYDEISKELNDRIFSPGGKDILLDSGAKQDLIQQVASSVAPINKQAALQLQQDIEGANSLRDLRAIQSKWIVANKALQTTENIAGKNFGMNTGDLMRAGLPIAGAVAGGGKGLIAGAVGAATSSQGVDKALAKGFSTVADAGKGPLGTIFRNPVTGITGGALGTATGTLNNAVQGNNNAGVGDMLPQDNSQIPQGLPTGGGDPQAMQRLLTLALYSPGALSSLAPSPLQQQNVSSALSAETALRGLPSPPTGGIMSNIAGHLGIGGTGEYQRQAASAAEQVANAIPGADKAAIQRQLTDYMAGGKNISSAITELLSRLQSVAQSNQQTGLQGILGFNGSPTASAIPR